MTETHDAAHSAETFIEPIGTCPLSGYPLLAVHETDGAHAGLALANIDETVRAKTRDEDGNAVPRLSVHDIATAAELLRSWSELLIYALHERAVSNPDALERDADQCRSLLEASHHYDTRRIIAAVHLAAVEHLRLHEPWTAPAMFLLPDVGPRHTRTTSQLAVRRLAGGDDGIPEALDLLRHRYHQRLAESA